MNNSKIYKRYRFPVEIIQYVVWFHFRFNLSHRRSVGPIIEDLLAQRGIIITHAQRGLGKWASITENRQWVDNVFIERLGDH